ncbi:hypothetical protein [Nitrosopumilus sp. b2]|uniref:hypothetical protein n=1 Tax=Nitrosopumilus sp. b2 TaxID=2109908 RepID=UPI0015F6D973|nr:hypothetical protein [Nitrosopumilus sp. b2]KAF6244553.1 hypothetical protein C6989_09860 [Nitrosopumilus sp. b2]
MGNNKKKRNYNANRRLAIKLFLIVFVFAVIISGWQIHLAYTTPDEVVTRLSEDSSFKTTLIDQEIIKCNSIPDGQVGLSYYNKTLGFSVNVPNINWGITEDNGYYVSNFGLIEQDNFLGGIFIDQRNASHLLISVFDDSENVSMEEFMGNIANQISKKTEWKYITIGGKEDNEREGELESEGLLHGEEFYIYQKAVRSDNKIYLIHYPNFDSNYPQNLVDEIDEMYLAVNIFPSCKT